MYSVASRNPLMREQNREHPALIEGTHDFMFRFSPSTHTKSREDPRKNEVFLWDCLIKCMPTPFFFLSLTFTHTHTKKPLSLTHTHTQPLPGGPISKGKGCTARRMQRTQTRRSESISPRCYVHHRNASRPTQL